MTAGRDSNVTVRKFKVTAIDKNCDSSNSNETVKIENAVTLKGLNIEGYSVM
ncbi:MAG: hypothetical protein ACYDG2_01770 [Ruminiclostridium sp.]